MGRGAYHVYQAEAAAARARGDTAGAIALSAKAGAALVVNPGPGRTAPAAPAGGVVRMAAAAGTGSPDAASLVRGIEANMAAARDALARAGTPVAMDAGLAAEVETWRRYKEAVALLKSADPREKARGSEIMRDPEVYRLHCSEAAGQPYRPAAAGKVALAAPVEAEMVRLAKSGDHERLSALFAANPAAHDRYRELRVAGALVPTAAERVEFRKLTDAELKKKIKALHASKDTEKLAELRELIEKDERTANIWREMCLTGEIVPELGG